MCAGSWEHGGDVKILVIDDEVKATEYLRKGLTEHGFTVNVSLDGADGLQLANQFHHDLLIVDVMMPGRDGWSVLREVRRAGNRTPALFLTALGSVDDKVKGLRLGADDYLVKPFAPVELLARIHALLRRPAVAIQDEPLRYADLSLDPVTRETQRGERAFELTSKEFDLLRYLMRHPRQVLEREQILQEVWGYDFGGDDNVLEVYIGYLRKKSEAGGEARLMFAVGNPPTTRSGYDSHTQRQNATFIFHTRTRRNGQTTDEAEIGGREPAPRTETATATEVKDKVKEESIGDGGPKLMITNAFLSVSYLLPAANHGDLS